MAGELFRFVGTETGTSYLKACWPGLDELETVARVHAMRVKIVAGHFSFIGALTETINVQYYVCGDGDYQLWEDYDQKL